MRAVKLYRLLRSHSFLVSVAALALIIYLADFSAILISVSSSLGISEAVSVSVVYRSVTMYFGTLAGFICINRDRIIRNLREKTD